MLAHGIRNMTFQSSEIQRPEFVRRIARLARIVPSVILAVVIILGGVSSASGQKLKPVRPAADRQLKPIQAPSPIIVPVTSGKAKPLPKIKASDSQSAAKKSANGGTITRLPTPVIQAASKGRRRLNRLPRAAANQQAAGQKTAQSQSSFIVPATSGTKKLAGVPPIIGNGEDAEKQPPASSPQAAANVNNNELLRLSQTELARRKWKNAGSCLKKVSPMNAPGCLLERVRESGARN